MRFVANSGEQGSVSEAAAWRSGPCSSPLPFPGRAQGGPGACQCILAIGMCPLTPPSPPREFQRRFFFSQTAAPRPSGNKWSLIQSVCGLKSHRLGGSFRKRSLWEPLQRARDFYFCPGDPAGGEECAGMPEGRDGALAGSPI